MRKSRTELWGYFTTFWGLAEVFRLEKELQMKKSREENNQHMDLMEGIFLIGKQSKGALVDF